MKRGEVIIAYRKINEHVGAIDIQGELTSFAERDLMNAYDQARETNVNMIILNCSAMEFMNSSGIGLLVTMLIRANREHIRLIAVGLRDHLRHILEITRLNEAVTIYTDEAQALALVTG